MKLVFAQGNPEARYDGTRHNVGFELVDRYVSRHGGAWSEKTKFFASISEMMLNGQIVLFAKPSTYYNETGRSARSLTDFYKLDPTTDILVIHDELALPFGTIRTRSSGSDAGNNGIKSLNASIGQQYARLRVGVYSELRDRIGDTDFVVGKFTTEEAAKLDDIYDLVEPLINAFIRSTHIDETKKI